MYSKQEASILRQAFWTAFGKYMLPVPDVWGDKVNWINYKTGIKNIYFRMSADDKKATVGIMLAHADDTERKLVYEQFLSVKEMLEKAAGEQWDWEPARYNEPGKNVAMISISLCGVSVFNQQDWPQIISFLKPRIIALDAFWQLAKPMFELQ